jgi:hypothetical protein
LTEESIKLFDIWDHFFDKESLIAEVSPAGFAEYEIFGDIAGKEFSEDSETVCGVFS